ncbi:phage tail protein [Acinetobacter sp. ANC 3781]|uniref:phage tail protein n=1 Tax=Acinetobacter sp. ANC 3781 TaxID=2529835 RepID=UPI0013F15D74|nr:phage tail protein [Acinetobacter sp. ANC 3781]
MGGSSDQVIGYRYFTKFLMFIGNPIEKMLGINFDKRGWLSPFVDEDGNPLAQGIINSPNLYGENEGGVAGTVHVQYGRDDQEVLPFYKDYMESRDLQASAYPYQSYLAFTGLGKVNTGNGWIDGALGALAGHMNEAFYVGNSGYMKEMLLWPKRTRIRNDGRRQWYEVRGDGAIVCEIGAYSLISDDQKLSTGDISFIQHWEVEASNGMDSSDSSSGTWRLPSDLLFPPVGLTGDIGEGGSLKVSLSFTATGYGIASVDFFYTHLKDKVPDLSLIKLFNVKEKKLEGSPEDITTTYQITADFFISQGFELFAATSANAENDATIVFSNIKIFDPRIRTFSAGKGVDINPIHKIREILTDDTAMNKPESSVNNDNFIKAADRIYDEGLGVSWSITEKSCIDAINELCYHIEAGIRANRQTGLYEMVLFRDDWFEEDEIHTIAESKIKSMQYEIINADEVINQVNVNYYDRENIKNSSFSISENGLIQTLNRVNAETLDFPYFMNMRNAEVVANWKLKQLSTGAFKGSFTTGWREARKWNRYDLIRLPWSKRWTGTILVRIMSINLGGPTNNEVSIDFIEVVPSTGIMNTTIVADEPIDKPLPPQPIHYEPFELPYYLAVMALGQRQVDEELAYESNFGLVGVVAEQPQSNSLYAVMMTNNYDEWVRAGSIQYSETADLDQKISKVSTSFTVKNWKKISNVPVGTLIQCGKEWLTGFVEWMVFQGVDLQTGIVSVKRGALDTHPQEWDLGLKLYFCGTDVAYDETEYVAGEKVLVSALTTTPSGVLELKGSHSVEMKARAIRPYPPANVKINGEYWPKFIENELTMTWSHRNRKQQTGGALVGWYENSVTLENGVEYIVEIYEINLLAQKSLLVSQNVGNADNAKFDLTTVSSLAKSIEIVFKTVRDGYACLYPFQHIMNLKSIYIDFKINPDEQYVAPNNHEVNFSL